MSDGGSRPLQGVHSTSCPEFLRPPRLRTLPAPAPLPQELTMADLAFVAVTIAVFALVALVAKGVAKL